MICGGWCLPLCIPSLTHCLASVKVWRTKRQISGSSQVPSKTIQWWREGPCKCILVFSLYWCHLVNKFIQNPRSFLRHNNWRFWITSEAPSILYCLEALWSMVSFPLCKSWRRLLLTLCSLFHMTNNQIREHWRRRSQIPYVLLTPRGMSNRCLFSSPKPYNCLHMRKITFHY